jgi:acyl carrier protein
MNDNNMKSIDERVICIFSDILDIDHKRINDDTSPENTPEWDSLAAMNLVSAVEEEFQINLTTTDIMKMRSIAIVKQVIAEKEVV